MPPGATSAHSTPRRSHQAWPKQPRVPTDDYAEQETRSGFEGLSIGISAPPAPAAEDAALRLAASGSTLSASMQGYFERRFTRSFRDLAQHEDPTPIAEFGQLGHRLGTPAILQMRSAPAIQPKLAISEPGDAYEQEADRVADEVMRMPNSAFAAGENPARRSGGPILQRACAACAAEDDKISRKEAPGQAPAVATTGQALSIGVVGAGQPLPRPVRDFFEPRFGRDLASVRIHTDSLADQSARSFNALAYTLGHHVVFAQGEFAPASDRGRRLLAHELTHVVQQSASDMPAGPRAAAGVDVAQRTPAPMLQGFWVTKEAAGGCGICYGQLYPQAPAAAAGKAAHIIIQRAFLDMLAPLYRLVEFPYSSPTDDNGQLDLAIATPTGFKIGEIKPANPTGEEQGVKDLDWYRTTLQAAYPQSTIELMDVRAPGSGLAMFDPLAVASGCQVQTLGVTAMRPGLYGYWCSPPFSVERRRCSCRPGDGQTFTEADAIETALDAAAVTARLSGRVEEAVRLEDLAAKAASAIAEGVAAASEAVEDVGIFARIGFALEEVFE